MKESAPVEVFSTIEDAAFPAWSPSGENLVASRAGRHRWKGLLLIGRYGAIIEPLTRSPGNDYWATWSPDGTRVAFSRDWKFDRKQKEFLATDVHVLELATDEVTNVTRDKTLNLQPDWSP